MCGRAIFSLLCLACYVNCATVPNTDTNICTSTICESESIELLSYMDQTIDPCENFYDFVCGKYLREKVLPEDKSNDLSIFNLGDKVREEIRDVLSEESKPNELRAFKLAKDFQKICMDEETQNAAGIQPMLKLLEKYGGWPVIKGENEWNGDNYDWLEVKQQLLNDGFLDDLILDLKFPIDLYNTSKRAIFIDLPRKLGGADYLNEKRYHNHMVDVAVFYGANRSVAEREMQDALQFEKGLDKIVSQSSYILHILNMTTLQATYPLLDWHEFINWNLKHAIPIYENDTINVAELENVNKLKELLEATPKRTIANYIGMRLALFSSDLLNDDLRTQQQQYHREKSGVLKSDPRIMKCAKKTAELLPISTAALYVRKYFNEKSKVGALAIAKDIKNVFIETLKNITWMDEQTREAAIEKANRMDLLIGHPDEMTDDHKLEEYYSELELQPDSLLHSVLRIRQFQRNKQIHGFRDRILRNDWREIAPLAATVEAFYHPSMNSIIMTAGFLQDELFKPDRPTYMNYGTIGWFAGHEITHGYDMLGRMRDANANVNNWWNRNTLEEFLSRAHCFIDKYSEYKHPAMNLTVDGEYTQDENIADTGGLKAAYAAYQRFVQENGPEPTLPNLNYTQNQLYWINAAHTWCAVTRPEFDTNQYTNEFHSPFRHRINGAFSSSTEFANDFNCPSNSSMNPTKKCEIW